MTWVKVCGLRTGADVEAAGAAGADAIGLNLIEMSPRHVDADTARRLAEHTSLPAVLLLDSTSVAEAERLVEQVGAAGIQPYGETAAAVAGRGVERGWLVLRPRQVRGPVRLDEIPDGQIPLLDGYHPDAMGGTGVQLDPSHLPDRGHRFVLAGGLDPDNVASIVRQMRPWGVDVSSGLESAPGVKDADRIRAFVERAKHA